MTASNSLADIVILSDLNEPEFKELCSQLFKRLGYTCLEPVNRRDGVWADITMTSPTNEKVIALCIHRLGAEIGSNEILKLYATSSLSSEGKGLLVTTGHLSKDAWRLVDNLNGRVEAWDLPRFMEKAQNAGLKISETSYDIQEIALAAMTTEKVAEYIMKELLEIRNFNPGRHRFDLKTEIEYHPIYRIRCRVSRVKTNHIGEVLELEGFHTIYIDGRDGTPLHHLSTWYEDMPAEPLRAAEPHTVHDFNLTPEQAIESLYGILGEKYAGTESQEVSGREGFHVTKISKNHIDIDIASITRLLLPIHTCKITILNTKYTFKCYTKPPNHISIVLNELARCIKCHRELPPRKRIICNECGRITHYSLRGKHAQNCWICWKTICSRCTTTKRKWHIIPVKYCPTCLRKQESSHEEKTSQIKTYTQPHPTITPS